MKKHENIKKVISENDKDIAYLTKNPSWHTEDSRYKSWLVSNAIQKNEVNFRTCADIGCGAGLVTEILAQKYTAKIFHGYEISPSAEQFIKQRNKLKNLSFYNENFVEQVKRYDLIVCLDA